MFGPAHYSIYAENGKKFCEITKNENDTILATKQGELHLNMLIAEIYCYDIALKMKNRRDLDPVKKDV